MINETTYDQHPPDREFGPTVLIVDNEAYARERLELALSEVEDAESLHILHCSNLPEAIATISSTPVNVVLLDKSLGPDPTDTSQNGIEAIPEMLQLQPHLQILVVTGSNDIQDVVRAMKLGACGYVTKETPGDLLITHINRAINVSKLTLDKIRRDRAGSGGESSVDPEKFTLGGRSRTFQEILRNAQLLAESNRPVLLLGDTGTGKTALAKWINECRARFLKQKDRPFFAINVATLTKELVESELFGHEKGAFTDAKEVKQGLFELANKGTLFLDEIGEMRPETQAKLLTVIEDGTFYRIGGKQPIRSSPKLIFATNRNLEQMVRDGLFRKDLYMRISMFPIHMPPLSERKEDIPEIIRAVLPRHCAQNHVHVTYEEIPADFIEYLMNTPLEGNIRGIQNQIDRLLVLAPRDKTGKPILKKWRTIPGLYVRPGRPYDLTEDKKRNVLTLSDLMNLPTDVIGPEFPGLNPLLDSLADRILLEATTKFKRNRDIARALKLADSSTSTRLKRFQTRSVSVSNGSVNVGIAGSSTKEVHQ